MTYLDLPMLEYSLRRYHETATPRVSEHILLDHHWPFNYWPHRKRVLELAEEYKCKVMSPYKNLGAHHGYNWVLNNIPIQDHDLFITYDADSNPQSKYWDLKMAKALEDPTYAFVSMNIDGELRVKDWDEDVTSSGVRVKRPRGDIEMFNVSMYRWSFLKAIGGFSSKLSYYGLVEENLFKSAAAMGLKHGYVIDAVEKPRFLHAHPEYELWKNWHVAGKYRGNFSEWMPDRLEARLKRETGVFKGDFEAWVKEFKKW